MEWFLMLSLALGDPDAFQLAQVKSEEDCRQAARTFFIVATEVAKQRGESAPELYLECKGVKQQVD